MYKKLCNEVKAYLVSFLRKIDILALVKFLQEIDSNLKIFAKSSYRSKNATTASTSISKLLSKTFSSAPTKLLTFVEVTVTTSILNMLIKIYSSLMNVLTAIRRELISQKEKNHHNCLGFCYYYSKPCHITIDHKNLATLATKGQVTSITNHLIALVFYVSLTKEKESFLS